MNQKPVFSPGMSNLGRGCRSRSNLASCGSNRFSDMQARLYREMQLDRDVNIPIPSGEGSHVCSRATGGQRSAAGCSCSRQNHHHTQAAVPQAIPSVRGEGCGCEDRSHDCSKILKQLRTVDFALYEVILYLDAYPDHCDAMELYHKLLQRRHDLIVSYEASCGPLTAYGNVSQTSWDWVKAPAPWEYSQN